MKKYFLRLPDVFLEKLETLNDNVVSSTTLEIAHSDIILNKYIDLGIQIIDNKLSFPKTIIPKESKGRFSKKNANGFFVTRRDLPKKLKSIDYGLRPYFGDWSKGSYFLTIDRLVYIKEFHYPKQLRINLELLTQNSIPETTYTIKFTVDEVLNKNSSTFLTDLLFNVNLLQENIGKSDIFNSEATEEEYLKTTNLTWEIFPNNGSDESFGQVLRNLNKVSSEDLIRIQERYEILKRLNPQEFIVGISGMRRYFGAKFLDDLVVFENLDYGNAIYILFENWQALSLLSRTEIINRPEKDFVRIEHTKNWQEKLAATILHYRDRKATQI